MYVSEGESGRIWVVNASDGTRKRPIELNQDGVTGSYSGDIAFDPERKLLYAADQGNSRLAVVDVSRRRVTASLKLGSPPRGLALAPDRRRAYIIVGSQPPALGVVNLENPAAPVVSETIPMGAIPSGVLAMADRVYVSDSGQDSISVIDAKTNHVLADVPLRIPGLEDLRGLVPMGMALHAPTGWLLVAEAGANAVGVVDTKEMKAIGHLPVGWSPARVLIEGESVYVTNFKGQGAGPNTGRRVHDETFARNRRRFLHDVLRADVRSHDDHGVLEIDRPPLPVCDPAVVEYLQQDVENILVGLFDLVEEHHGIRLAPHRFAKLAALFVTDITGRRADQPRDGVFLHIFAHVDADHGLLVIEQKFRQRARQLCLADPGRSQKNEGTDRPVFILQSGAGPADRAGDCFDGRVLTDHALVQMFLEPDELLALAFLQTRDRNVRPARNDLRDIFFGYFFAQQAITALFNPLLDCA